MFSLGLKRLGFISYLYHRLICSSLSWLIFMVPPSLPISGVRSFQATESSQKIIQRAAQVQQNQSIWGVGEGSCSLYYIKISSLNQLCQQGGGNTWPGGEEAAPSCSRCHGITLSLPIIRARNKFAPVHTQSSRNEKCNGYRLYCGRAFKDGGITARLTAVYVRGI